MGTTTKTTKHFKFTGETKVTYGVTLHRIRATIETIHAKLGDIGGWVEKPDNLCDNAWVFGNAQVYGGACVSGNAWVSDNAIVCGNACVCDNAHVSGCALVSGNACVLDNAWVSDDAEVHGNTRVSGKARVTYSACVYNNAHVTDNAYVSGDAEIYDNAHVSGNARVFSDNDHCGFDSFGSDTIHTHAYRTTNGIEIVSGSFRGSLDEFVAKIKETYCDSEYEKQYELIIRLIKLKFYLLE